MTIEELNFFTKLFIEVRDNQKTVEQAIEELENVALKAEKADQEKEEAV